MIMTGCKNPRLLPMLNELTKMFPELHKFILFPRTSVGTRHPQMSQLGLCS